MTSSTGVDFAIATRIHLGQTSHLPKIDSLKDTLNSFACLAREVGATLAIVAVDATPKFTDYDFVATVKDICCRIEKDNDSDISVLLATEGVMPRITVIPVTPWGKFVPALNAIVTYCADMCIPRVLIISVEVKLTRTAMEVLQSNMVANEGCETLVVGATLNGHEHHALTALASTSSSTIPQPTMTSSTPNRVIKEVKLTGRTTPWNTCALWDVRKLALTGFLLVSEGLHINSTDNDIGGGSRVEGGVEEVVTIATLQHILGPKRACTKLVHIPPKLISWETDNFDNDAGRKVWHERKMNSKITRAQAQLALLGLNDGVVIHC
jgi:hypothetical protein